jgi:phosphoribosylaminoimidazole-succinocarboxamide synthase
MSEWKILYQGSVKDIFSRHRELIFSFSDRYSVFDWGVMPDELDGKGRSLALMSEFFFRQLEVSHHGIGLCDSEGQPVKEADRFYKVNAVDVHRPDFINGSYHYDVYQKRPTNCLVPLEVVFRFGIPKGSSLLSRISAQKYREELGLDRVYEEGEFLSAPVIEFSTKLENSDRYLSYAEASYISGMNQQEFLKLVDLAKNSANRLKDIFAGIDVVLWDGKFEFSFTEESGGVRDFQMVDSIGPDELRLSYQSMTLSKEFLRQYYRTHPWYLNIKESQKLASERNEENWKKICIEEFKSTPPKLDHLYKEVAEMIYKTLTNELYAKYYQQQPFEKNNNFQELLKKYESIL